MKAGGMKVKEMEILLKEPLSDGAYGEVFKRNDGVIIIQYSNKTGDSIRMVLSPDTRPRDYTDWRDVYRRIRECDQYPLDVEIDKNQPDKAFIEKLLDESGLLCQRKVVNIGPKT